MPRGNKGKKNQDAGGGDGAGGQPPPPGPQQPGPSGAGDQMPPVQGRGKQKQAPQQPKPRQPQPGPAPSAAAQPAAGQPDVPKPPKLRNKYAKKEPEPAPAPAAATPPSISSTSQTSSSDPSLVEVTRSMSVTSLSSTGSAAQTEVPAAVPSAAAITVAAAKGAGTCGRKILVDVNYLALNIEKLVPIIYHYDVNIEPNMPKRHMPNVFEAFRKLNFPKVFIAFDGQKNAYSPQLLKLEQIKERKIMFQDEESYAPRAYMVNMKEVKTSNKIDMTTLQT